MLEANNNDELMAVVRMTVMQLVCEAKEVGGEEAAAELIGVLFAMVAGVSIAAVGKPTTLGLRRPVDLFRTPRIELGLRR